MAKNARIFRFFAATHYALQGLRAAWRTEPAFRQECWLLLLALPLAIYLGHNLLQRSILIAVLIVILIVELLNSAIETTLDKISTDPHPFIKRAKDLAAAAVLLAFINAAIVWLAVIFQ